MEELLIRMFLTGHNCGMQYSTEFFPLTHQTIITAPIITSSCSPNHDWPAELCCRGTISVEQSSCCSTETRDDSAHFQETTEGLSVTHLMCWRIEGTFTTARRGCGVSIILAPDTKLQTCLLTYLQLRWYLLERRRRKFCK